MMPIVGQLQGMFTYIVQISVVLQNAYRIGRLSTLKVNIWAHFLYQMAVETLLPDSALM